VTPGLRGGKTRAHWTADHVPVLPYQAQESNAHDWRLTYAKPGEAGMELLLHPAKSEKLGPIAFTIRVKQVRGRWLVDTWYPNAIFAKEGDRSNITAVPDLGPAAVPDHGQADDKPSSAWISIPLLIVGLPVLIGVGAAVIAAIRAIRNRRRIEPIDERALASWEAYRPDRDADRDRV
jgi:hypothetical protein